MQSHGDACRLLESASSFDAPAQCADYFFFAFSISPDLLLHTLLDLVDGEAGRYLARWVVDEGLQERGCPALGIYHHKDILDLGLELRSQQSNVPTGAGDNNCTKVLVDARL